MSLRTGWIVLLHRAATSTRRTRTLLTPLGLVVFAAFTALFVAAALLTDDALRLPGLLPAGLRRPIAVPILATGVALTAWSAFHFLRVKGTPVPFNPPPELVATGPYRFVRNPMLTGVFLLLAGIGVALGSPSLVFVFVPLFILANVWELRNIEEPELARRLGDAYLDYRERTPMFVPRSRRGSRTRERCLAPEGTLAVADVKEVEMHDDQRRDAMSRLERRAIEAAAMAPLVRAVADRLGHDEALALLTAVNQEEALQRGREAAVDSDDAVIAALVRDVAGWGRGGEWEMSVLEETPTTYCFDVTRCPYAEKYHELGVRDLGVALSCCRDEPFARGLHPRLRLERTSTLMEGGDHCDFRYRLLDP